MTIQRSLQFLPLLTPHWNQHPLLVYRIFSQNYSCFSFLSSSLCEFLSTTSHPSPLSPLSSTNVVFFIHIFFHNCIQKISSSSVSFSSYGLNSMLIMNSYDSIILSSSLTSLNFTCIFHPTSCTFLCFTYYSSRRSLLLDASTCNITPATSYQFTLVTFSCNNLVACCSIQYTNYLFFHSSQQTSLSSYTTSTQNLFTIFF